MTFSEAKLKNLKLKFHEIVPNLMQHNLQKKIMADKKTQIQKSQFFL